MLKTFLHISPDERAGTDLTIVNQLYLFRPILGAIDYNLIRVIYIPLFHHKLMLNSQLYQFQNRKIKIDSYYLRNTGGMKKNYFR